MNYKALVFDLDGTLTPSAAQHCYPEVAPVLRQAKENGLHIFIATGRSSFFVMKDIREETGVEAMVTANGMIVLDKDENILAFHPIAQKTFLEFVQDSREKDYPAGFKFKDQIVVFNGYERFVARYGSAKVNQYLIKNAEDCTDPTVFGETVDVFMFGDPDYFFSLQERFPDLTVILARHQACEAYPRGYNKFTGLQDLFRSYGLKEEEVIAFGDSENDEEMLKRCGLGIAMGNATEGAKKAADFVTLPCDQDGIGYALRHFGLI